MAVDAEISPTTGQSLPKPQALGSGHGEAMKMEVVSGEVWDQKVASFDGLAQEQLYIFAKKRWPQVICEPVLFSRDAEIVGGALMMIQSLPLGLGAIAVAKWAPFLRDNSHPNAVEIYAGIVEALIAEYADKRAMMLSILPKATASTHNMAFEYLKTRGFSNGSKLLFPNRYIVNLTQSNEDQRRSLSQKWRYHLNKSEKQGLTFERANPDQMEEFFTLYEAMSVRKKFADHSAFDTIDDLMAVDDQRLRPEMFFVRHQGKIVAGAIVFKAGDTAVYLYGATNDQALPLRAGYFMQWHIMGWLRDNTKAIWYDLGGTDGFQGLHQFKKGMVGNAGHMEPVPPVMNYASHLWVRVVATLAYELRDRLQHLRRFLEKIRTDLATPDQE